MTALETYSISGFMTLDAHTRRNLELFESGRGGSVKGSLLWVLDATRTPMGGRLLRRWLGGAAARSGAAAAAAGRRGRRASPISPCAPGWRRCWAAWATWSG